MPDAKDVGCAGGPVGGDLDVDLVGADKIWGVYDGGHAETARGRVVVGPRNVTGKWGQRRGGRIGGTFLTRGQRAVERAESGDPEMDDGSGRRRVFDRHQRAEVPLGGGEVWNKLGYRVLVVSTYESRDFQSDSVL